MTGDPEEYTPDLTVVRNLYASARAKEDIGVHRVDAWGEFDRFMSGVQGSTRRSSSMTGKFVRVQAGVNEGVVYFHAGHELWVCRNCGVVAAGREEPGECPVCDAVLIEAAPEPAAEHEFDPPADLWERAIEAVAWGLLDNSMDTADRAPSTGAWKAAVDRARQLLPTLVPAAPFDELAHLRTWQAEAIDVLSRWERVWEAAGRPGRLGASKADNVREWIEELVSTFGRAGSQYSYVEKWADGSGVYERVTFDDPAKAARYLADNADHVAGFNRDTKKKRDRLVASIERRRVVEPGPWEPIPTEGEA